MTWPSVWRPRAGAGPCEAALGRNDQPIRIGRQSFGDQLLADARTVGIGRVDEGDAQFDYTSQQTYRCCPIRRWTPDARTRDPHSAEPEPADAEIAKAQRAGRRLVAGNEVIGCHNLQSLCMHTVSCHQATAARPLCLAVETLASLGRAGRRGIRIRAEYGRSARPRAVATITGLNAALTDSSPLGRYCCKSRRVGAWTQQSNRNEQVLESTLRV